MTRARVRNAKRMTAWGAVTVLTATAIGWLVLGAERAETAPAPRPDVYEAAVRGPAGGFEADLRGVGHAAVYATRAPDGRVSVECADHETATAMVAGTMP
jgi:hypothetical protein